MDATIAFILLILSLGLQIFRLLTLFTFFGVNYLLPSLHSYV